MYVCVNSYENSRTVKVRQRAIFNSRVPPPIRTGCPGRPQYNSKFDVCPSERVGKGAADLYGNV